MTPRKKIIAICAIPGCIVRGRQQRADLEYLQYAIFTWSYWCKVRGIELVVISKRQGELPEEAPPTLVRWACLASLLEQEKGDVSIGLVDADTMVRWDAPDFFDFIVSPIAAAPASNLRWVVRSIGAYGHLFEAKRFPLRRYFNCGLVIATRAAVAELKAFNGFVASHYSEILAIAKAAEVGTDQTPMNLFLHQRGTDVQLIPREFNEIGCFGYDPKLRLACERDDCVSPESFRQQAFDYTPAFAFVEKSFVWHFSNVVRHRTAVMAETWRRVGKHYL